MDDDAAADDERLMELETLEAIFPEIQKLQSGKLVSFSIEVPVHPATPVTVTFPAGINNGAPPVPQAPDDNEPRVDSQELAHLPAVVVRVDLPQGYPADKPPVFSVTTDPPWLSPSSARHLEAEGLRMWEDLGHNLVAYDFIDHVQQAADAVFDMIDADATLKIDPLHKIAILDYDIKARKAAFDRETFDCGVCIEPKKGAACHQMLDCAHVFCKACLQDFYNNAIKEGDLAVVRCPFPDCAKKRANAGGPSKKRKARTYINPSELLQMGLEQDMVTRYVTLKYKNELESDKNTIYCPRSWCDGAARSKKHKKPEGLELVQASDDEDEDEDENEEATENGDGKKKKKATFDMNDLLAICEDCGFAFCSRCLQSWHGEFYHCAPRRDKDEITAEEQASIDYLKLHTSPCPTCAAPVQKTHGCNHMICFRCNSHFCYLCSAWLDPSNPYQHFNIQPNGKVTSCYQRLWELEGGDGDNVGYAFAGGVGGGAAPLPNGDQVILEPEIEEPDNGGRAGFAGFIPNGPNGNVLDIVDPELLAPRGVRRPVDIRPPNVDLAPAPARVAREGPLVLRIGGDPVPRGARNAVPPPAPQAPAPRGRGGNRGARGARGGRGGGAARPPGARAPNGPNEQQGDPLANIDELDEHQEAWIRNFVRLALLDEEDSDDEDVHHQPPRQ